MAIPELSILMGLSDGSFVTCLFLKDPSYSYDDTWSRKMGYDGIKVYE